MVGKKPKNLNPESKFLVKNKRKKREPIDWTCITRIGVLEIVLKLERGIGESKVEVDWKAIRASGRQPKAALSGYQDEMTYWEATRVCIAHLYLSISRFFLFSPLLFFSLFLLEFLVFWVKFVRNFFSCARRRSK